MTALLHRFAYALAELLEATSPDAAEQTWRRWALDELGWAALGVVGPSTNPSAVPILDETDGLLLKLRDRLPLLRAGRGGQHLQMFRLPTVERLQHAAAAALVAHRLGTAGLATVVSDGQAPLGRRYHAFLLLARLHADVSWPLFRRYLVPDAHHAFLGLSVEAARFYPSRRPAPDLVALFDAVRGDLHLRAFLGPRLLESLFALRDPVALPLYRELVVSGHTSPDPVLCEVTHALVMLRVLTGRVPASAKFRGRGAAVSGWLDRAEARYERERERLRPVAVL
jgi:hypothetical protein